MHAAVSDSFLRLGEMVQGKSGDDSVEPAFPGLSGQTFLKAVREAGIREKIGFNESKAIGGNFSLFELFLQLLEHRPCQVNADNLDE